MKDTRGRERFKLEADCDCELADPAAFVLACLTVGGQSGKTGERGVVGALGDRAYEPVAKYEYECASE